jgi:hypothetical protein
MLSIERCKEILRQYGETEITEEEIKQLRSLLSDWARIGLEIEDEIQESCQQKMQYYTQE